MVGLMFWKKKEPQEHVRVMEVSSFIGALQSARISIERSMSAIPSEEMHKQALQATMQFKDPQKTSQVLLTFFDSLQEESKLAGKLELLDELIEKLKRQI